MSMDAPLTSTHNLLIRIVSHHAPVQAPALPMGMNAEAIVFDDDVELKVLRCWSNILGTSTTFGKVLFYE